HFFFSSRRRHTRWPRDWSSDVCSSDLGSTWLRKLQTNGGFVCLTRTAAVAVSAPTRAVMTAVPSLTGRTVPSRLTTATRGLDEQIGRASCRERVDGGEVGAAGEGRRED